MEVNFLGVYEWYYGEEKITLVKINKIAEARHEAEDLDYEKVLKYCLLVAYGEFKDFFLRNKAIPCPRPKTAITKLNKRRIKRY